jgi:DNA polymerase III alpha subunit
MKVKEPVYSFVEIEEIEEIEEVEDVYDIEVKDNHNFFINDILAHNCLGGPLSGDYWMNKDKGEEAILKAMRKTCEEMLWIFGDRWYGELQWNAIEDQHKVNQYIIQMSKEFKFELVSTADSHYYRPELWKDRELYKKLGWLGKKTAEEMGELPNSVEEIGYELYPKNGNQMWDAYKHYSNLCGYTYDDNLILESIERTHDIAHNRIERFYPDTSVKLPNFVVPEGQSADKILAKMCKQALIEKGLDKNKEYIQRCIEELKVIKDRDFSKYFLTMKAITDRAKKTQLTGLARGCFLPGTQVRMASGELIPIEQVKVGSQAIDHQSNPQVVKDTLQYDIDEQIIELEFENGTIIKCTADHKFYTNNRGWVPAQDLTEQDDIREV